MDILSKLTPLVLRLLLASGLLVVSAVAPALHAQEPPIPDGSEGMFLPLVLSGSTQVAAPPSEAQVAPQSASWPEDFAIEDIPFSEPASDPATEQAAALAALDILAVEEAEAEGPGLPAFCDGDSGECAAAASIDAPLVLTVTDSVLFSQDSGGIPDSTEPNDYFGWVVAAGDFDADGREDLVVGVPYEAIGAASDAGAVNVIYAAPGGLAGAGSVLFSQATSGVLETSEAGDQFGAALASGDFNRDGYADLAIGVRYEDVGALVNAGLVHVLYGGAGGVSTTGDMVFTQDTGGAPGVAEASDEFGHALAAGDFDGDGFDDLAIGVPGEDIGATNSAGAVNVLYGAAAGLSATGSQLFYQGNSNVVGTFDAGDRFGQSLAAGDFDGDGRDDLAVGVPYEDDFLLIDVGAVVTLSGSASGLTGTGSDFITENYADVPDTAEAGEQFGSALATGDFNGDGLSDLAVGVPFEQIGPDAAAGAVFALYGAAGGLTTGTDSQMLSQDTPAAVEGVSEANDHFGHALAAGDFTGDGRADLAVGVPDETIGAPAIGSAGAVNILNGAAGGLTASGDQLFTMDTDGVPGAAVASDDFGRAVAVGNFTGDRRDDLAVGVPFRNVGADADAGSVVILYAEADFAGLLPVVLLDGPAASD